MSQHSDSESSTLNKKKKRVVISDDDGFESQSSASRSSRARKPRQNYRKSQRSTSPICSQGSSTGNDTGFSTAYGDEDESYSKQRQNKIGSQQCWSPPKKQCTIPSAVRLSVGGTTLYEKCRKTLPLPTSALPEFSLPSWKLMSLDNKIPNIPAPPCTVVFARGHLGQQIRVSKQQYSLVDPYNKEKTVGPYNSLHDPHASGYFSKPEIRNFLKKQGLIDENDQVLCSLKQFNKYRQYLKSFYNQNIEGFIQFQEKRTKEESTMEKKLKHYTSATSAHGYAFMKAERRRAAQAVIGAKRDKFLQKLEENQNRRQTAYCSYLTHKMRKRIDTTLLAQGKKQLQEERISHLNNVQTLRAQQIKILIAAKDKAAKERIAMNRKYIRNAYQQFVTEWLVTKYEQQELAIKRDKEVRESIEAEMQKRAVIRQKRLERYRELMGTLQAIRLKKERWVWDLVRTFFYRWLNKVRARRGALPDEKHQTLWDTTATLKIMLKYLQKESGYVNIGNLVLDMVNFKKNIKAQIEKEEAEEQIEKEGKHQTGHKARDSTDGDSDDAGEDNDSGERSPPLNTKSAPVVLSNSRSKQDLNFIDNLTRASQLTLTKTVPSQLIASSTKASIAQSIISASPASSVEKDVD